MIPGFPGVRLWVWPRHLLEVHGRRVPLSRRDGDLVAVFLSRPGRRWNIDEVVEQAYGEPDDEPDYGRDTIRNRISQLRRKVVRHGVAMDLRSRRGSDDGYTLLGFRPLPGWHPPPARAWTALDEAMVSEIRVRCDGGAKPNALAAEYGVHPDTVRRAARRETWAHLP